VDRAGNKSVEMAICEVEYKLYREFEAVDYEFLELRGRREEFERQGKRGDDFRRKSSGNTRLAQPYEYSAVAKAVNFSFINVSRHLQIVAKFLEQLA
jgi:hypothetical protein